MRGLRDGHRSANAIIDHPPGLQAILHRNLTPRPPVSDLFGAAGRRWLFRQELPEDEHHAIGALLRQLDFLAANSPPQTASWRSRRSPIRWCAT